MTKTKMVGTLVTPEKLEAVKAQAMGAGLSVSAYVGRLIERDLSGKVGSEGVAVDRSKGGSKITVRLPLDAHAFLTCEALEQGAPVSTWVTALLCARSRSAPQLVPATRRRAFSLFKQVRGMSVNINQIAHAVNKGVLTGAGAELSAKELKDLRAEVEALRKELTALAAGQMKFQIEGGQGSE